jgi:hypothetical protein
MGLDNGENDSERRFPSAWAWGPGGLGAWGPQFTLFISFQFSVSVPSIGILHNLLGIFQCRLQFFSSLHFVQCVSAWDHNLTPPALCCLCHVSAPKILSSQPQTLILSFQIAQGHLLYPIIQADPKQIYS